MRKLLALLFALVFVIAACGDDTGGASADDAPTTTAPAADAHEEGDEHAEDVHEDEAAHEEGDEHAEEAHEDEAAHEEGDEHAEEISGEFVSAEFVPEAVGEVTSEYTVTLTDFSYHPDVLDLTPGETVRFTLINEGLLGHEFRLTTEHKAEEHIAAGHDDHGEEGGHHEENADIIVNVFPGETRVVELTLPGDPVAIDHTACLIPGHYEAGMFALIEF